LLGKKIATDYGDTGGAGGGTHNTATGNIRTCHVVSPWFMNSPARPQASRQLESEGPLDAWDTV
jgi:hypothetical protein